MIAAKKSHRNVIDLLHHHNCDLTWTDREGTSAVMVGVLVGEEAVLRQLLSIGCHPGLPTSNGCTPLWVAAQRGSAAMVQALCSNDGVDVDAPKEGGVSPCYIAAQKGNNDCVRLLVRYGASLDLATHDGWLPSHIAAQNDHVQTISLRTWEWMGERAGGGRAGGWRASGRASGRAGGGRALPHTTADLSLRPTPPSPPPGT